MKGGATHGVKYPPGNRGVDAYVVDVVAQELRHVIDTLYIKNVLTLIVLYITILRKQENATEVNVTMEYCCPIDVYAGLVGQEPAASQVSGKTS